MASEAAQSRQPAARLNADLLCLGCGYNLRGLDPTSNCPECGLPIERTQRGRWLWYSSDRYLQAVLVGAWLVLLGGSTLLVCTLGYGLFWTFDRSSATDLVFLLLALVVPFGLYALGWWLLAQPDESCTGVEPRMGIRRATRVCTTIVTMATALWCMLVIVALVGGAPAWERAVQPATGVLGGLLFLHVIASLWYLQVLGQRLGCRSFAALNLANGITALVAALLLMPPLLDPSGTHALIVPAGAALAICFALYVICISECVVWTQHVLRQPFRRGCST